MIIKDQMKNILLSQPYIYADSSEIWIIQAW